jgi:hypothetical protein
MKAPESFKNAYVDARSVDDVLVRMSMAKTHVHVRELDQAYACRVEELIAGGLKEDPKSRSPDTIEKLIKDLDRRAFTQLPLPFPEEQIAHEPLERLLAAIEAALPVLWIDDETGEVITIRVAVERPALLEKAVALLHEYAVSTRKTANHANWCLRAVAEVANRVLRSDAAE